MSNLIPNRETILIYLQIQYLYIHFVRWVSQLSIFKWFVRLITSRYLLMQIPSNMLMSSTKIRPSIYMGLCMAAWAVVSALTALVHNYAGLVSVRFFLGITEAPFCESLPVHNNIVAELTNTRSWCPISSRYLLYQERGSHANCDPVQWKHLRNLIRWIDRCRGL